MSRSCRIEKQRSLAFQISNRVGPRCANAMRGLDALDRMTSQSHISTYDGDIHQNLGERPSLPGKFVEWVQPLSSDAWCCRPQCIIPEGLGQTLYTASGN